MKYIVREYMYMHADDRVRANQWLVPEQQEPRAKGAEQPGQTNGNGLLQTDSPIYSYIYSNWQKIYIYKYITCEPAILVYLSQVLQLLQHFIRLLKAPGI